MMGVKRKGELLCSQKKMIIKVKRRRKYKVQYDFNFI